MSNLLAGSSRADVATLPPAVLRLLCWHLLNTQSSSPSRKMCWCSIPWQTPGLRGIPGGEQPGTEKLPNVQGRCMLWSGNS